MDAEYWKKRAETLEASLTKAQAKISEMTAKAEAAHQARVRATLEPALLKQNMNPSAAKAVLLHLSGAEVEIGEDDSFTANLDGKYYFSASALAEAFLTEAPWYLAHGDPRRPDTVDPSSSRGNGIRDEIANGLEAWQATERERLGKLPAPPPPTAPRPMTNSEAMTAELVRLGVVRK